MSLFYAHLPTYRERLARHLFGFLPRSIRYRLTERWMRGWTELGHTTREG